VDALVQSVELLTTLHRDLEKEAAARSAETDARFAETAARFAETTARFAETLQFINRLAHVAEAHEQRLEDLEGK
jgi:hypothetical protein